MSELLPCPFCGGDNLVEGFHSPFVICDDCGAFGPGNADITHEEAIERWNTRAGNTAQLIQELEDAKVEIRKLERRGEYMVRQIAKAKEALR